MTSLVTKKCMHVGVTFTFCKLYQNIYFCLFIYTIPSDKVIWYPILNKHHLVLGPVLGTMAQLGLIYPETSNCSATLAASECTAQASHDPSTKRLMSSAPWTLQKFRPHQPISWTSWTFLAFLLAPESSQSALFSLLCPNGLVALVAGATSLQSVDLLVSSQNLDKSLRPYTRYCANLYTALPCICI